MQHEVRDRSGRFVARVDLAYPAQRLAVEYDGDHHRARGRWRHDLARVRRALTERTRAGAAAPPVRLQR